MHGAILIPTKAREPALRTTVLGLLPQSQLAGWPVLICDQSPVPFRAPAPFAGVTVFHRLDLSGLTAARNALLAATAADWVLFLDDDCDLAADFLTQLNQLIVNHRDVDAWGPVVEVRPRWLRRCHRIFGLGAFRDPRRWLARPRDVPTRALFGCCCAIRRSALLRVGGFDPGLTGYGLGEDLDACLRLRAAGYRLRFAAVLRARHREEGGGRPQGLLEQLRARWCLLRLLARRHGRGNPITLVHLALAGAWQAALTVGLQRWTTGFRSAPAS